MTEQKERSELKQTNQINEIRVELYNLRPMQTSEILFMLFKNRSQNLGQKF